MPIRSSPNLVPFTVAQTGECVKVEGDPGTGKSATIAAFAKACGWHMHTLVGSLLQPTDFAVPYPDDARRHLRMLSADWVGMFQTLEEGLLFMDELHDCAPAQQTPIQRIMQERVVGDDALPPGLRMITACNSVELSTNGNDLSPPLANRMGHYPWEVDKEAWERGMLNGGKFPPPDFVVLPEDWWEFAPKHMALVAAFHRHLPGRENMMPKERSKRSGPWPSQRTWYKGAIAMAAMESIDAEPALWYRALNGFVGDDVGLEYQAWHAALDLPDPEAWLALAADFRSRNPQSGERLALEIPDRGDKVLAVLAGLVDRVKNHSVDPDTGQISEPRWLAGIDCCAAVAENWREPAMMAAADLFGAIKGGDSKGGGQRFLHLVSQVPADFAKECGELLRNIRSAG